MSKVKKIIIGVVVAALVITGAGAGLLSMRKANQKEVMVASVESLASTYYMPSTNLEGYITTSVSQNVYVDKDMIIENVYVQKGDNVKTGDKLITFDMTLVEMELNIAKLKRQKQEQDLNKAVNRLNSLQNGGPIEESDGKSPGNADNLDPVDLDKNNGDDELSRLEAGVPGNYLAAAIHPLLLAAFSDSGVSAEESAQTDEDSGNTGGDTMGAGQEDTQLPDNTGTTPDSIYQDPAANDFSSSDNEPDDPIFDSGKEPEEPKPSPTPTPELDDDTSFFDPYPQEGEPDLSDGQDPFYLELDGNTLPFEGKGTEDDPYIFLCSSAKGYVRVKGSFFNKMAGYNEDGTKILQEGGYWYQLEFHNNDTITDYLNRKESCTGYYLIDGSLLTQPVDMYSEMEFTLEGASQYEEELPPDDGGGGGTSEPVSTMTRAEAIKLQKNKIASLKLDLQESDINITKLEKKVSRQVAYSKLDGTVTYVGDALTGNSDGKAFIKVKSKEGFYVKGTVSELLLDQVKEGTSLNCMSYENGNFVAEVVDVSDYPVTSNSYYGDSNPNVSYYSFSAKIPDKSVNVRDQEWLNITLDSPAQDGSFVLSKAFVRTQDGSSFVYKDDNGVLKKQMISVGGSVEGGYSVLIKGGITKEDKIAFPYGKAVEEGAKTKEATIEEFYGY